MTDRAISPNALAKRLSIDVHKVLGWIRSGELRAHNLAEHTSGRPRWKILPDALDAFLAARQSTPATAPAPRKRKRRLAAVKEYY